MRFVPILGLLVAFLAACAAPSVGGYPVGDRRCTDAAAEDQEERELCDLFRTFARSTLDEEVPEHASIVTVEVYREPPDVARAFGGYGDVAIIAFRLADDTLKAFHIQCGVGLSKEMCLPLASPGST